VPPEVEWFANISNRHTRRAYENAVKDFMRFTGIERPEEFRIVTRAHIIAWRDDLVRRGLGGSTIRHRLASLASLFEYLCEKNAVTHNPVKGVERPKAESGEGKTPAIGDHQARKLLDAPQEETIKSKRDRAILSTLLFHALRREELCKLKVKDARHERKGVPHLKVSGKGGKTRYLPLHPGTAALIHDYLEVAGHGPMKTVRCFGRSRTTPPARSNGRSRRTASTSWCAPIRRCSVSRSAPMRCARRPRPTPSTTRPTSPRCRNGSGTRIFPRRASTITAARARRTARRLRWPIEMEAAAVATVLGDPAASSRCEPRRIPFAVCARDPGDRSHTEVL
jgi:integrase